MKITTLIENKSYKENIVCEYGLSLYVETLGHAFIMDCGQKDLVLQNIDTLNVDMSKVEAVVISHNHFDHIGGLEALLTRLDDTVPVYASSETNRVYFTKHFLEKKHLASNNNILPKIKDRLNLVADCENVLPNVYACRVQYPDKNYFCKDKKLKELVNGKLVPDNFQHEIYIAVIENNECKILSPCSHNGIVNIVADAERRFKNIKVTSFVGGLHFRGNKTNSINCKKNFIIDTVNIINKSSLQNLYTCHCTGQMAYSIIKDNATFNTRYFSSGDIFEL